MPGLVSFANINIAIMLIKKNPQRLKKVKRIYKNYECKCIVLFATKNKISQKKLGLK